MGIFRLFSTKDTWITSKLDSNLVAMTGSNFGSDPLLEVFSIKSNFSGTNELARSLIYFPLTELSGKIYSDLSIPSSSVSYFLKMHNIKHGDTVPTSYDLFVYPLSKSWDEGTGVDFANLSIGYASWISASSVQGWAITGSDFNTVLFSASQHFDRGSEDLEVNVTQFINEWLTGSNLSNNGFLIKLGNTEETNSIDYYVKRFHGRESKFIDKLPYIEARWSNLIKDNRNNFAYNQTNNLYLYNFVRGELVNLTEPITLRIQDHITGSSASYTQTFTPNRVEVGIYSASIYIDNSASFSGTFYDIWFSGARAYMTSSFKPLKLTGSSVDQYNDFTLSINNLRQIYSANEEARFRVNVRKKNFKTHIGVAKSASLDMEREYIEKLYYMVENNETGEVVIPFGTGTVPYTQLGYDSQGNYFNIFFNSFVPGFTYRVKFLIDINKYDRKIYRK